MIVLDRETPRTYTPPKPVEPGFDVANNRKVFITSTGIKIGLLAPDDKRLTWSEERIQALLLRRDAMPLRAIWERVMNQHFRSQSPYEPMPLWFLLIGALVVLDMLDKEKDQ